MSGVRDMRPFLNRYSELLYAAMRVVLAFVYLSHGLQKLFGAFGGRVVPPASLFGVAGVLEAILGGLVLVGLFTPWAAFVASGEMAAGQFIADAPPWRLRIKAGGVLALTLCLAILCTAS